MSIRTIGKVTKTHRRGAESGGESPMQTWTVMAELLICLAQGEE
jgi:hypothetical protein